MIPEFARSAGGPALARAANKLAIRADFVVTRGGQAPGSGDLSAGGSTPIDIGAA
jgi:hypothetical protein